MNVFIVVSHLILCLVLMPHHLLSAELSEPSFKTMEEVSNVKILSPTLSDRKTKKIKLLNGLEAYLISDPNTDQSGVALSVNAGSWMDPDEYPGLAHFLEHMLFLGTKKYPDEASFSGFISGHGGLTNAFTASDFTSFMYSVENSAFPESLDRFSSFFIEPLFNPSGVARELNAIDQEFAKNFEDDDFRLFSVLKEIGNPLHPNSRFSIGNSETLRHVSREVFIDWYQKHYSANLMRLTALSNLPLEQMQDLVVKDFQGIVNKNLVPETIELPLVSNTTKDKILYVTPLKNIQKLLIIWDLPLELHSVKADQAPAVVCQVLGHEGSHSLLEILKKENLAETIACQAIDIGGQNQELFIEVGLTSQGVKEINKVIKRVYQTIAKLRANGLPAYLFDEIQQLARINYQYQSQEGVFRTMMMHGSQMMEGDFNGYPETNMIPQKYNPEAIIKVVNQLTPENAVTIVMAPTLLTGVQPTMKEKWLSVPYAIKTIPSDILTSWKLPEDDSDINLPVENPFIPQKLNLFYESPTAKVLQTFNKPVKILDNDHGNIYYSQDNYFRLPYLSLLLNVKTPEVDAGIPNKCVMADLYVELMKNILSPLNYSATIAGLSYEIKRDNFGIIFNIQGYSDQAPLLLETILKQIKSVTFDEQNFKTQKDILLRSYQNESLATPLHQAQELLKSAIYKKYVSPKALANAIKKVSFESFNEYANKIFSKAYLEGMFYGNLTEPQARQFSDLFITTLNSLPYPKKNHKSQEMIVLPANKGPFYLEANIKVQGNATILAVQNGAFTFTKRAAQQILMEAISDPFFTTLRTQQQTGYLVDTSAYELEKQLFCLFFTQSSTHDPRDLLARFELFTETFLKNTAENIPVESFNNLKNAFLSKLKMPAKNMNEMGKLLNLLAFTYDGDFSRIEKRIESFQKLSYEDFLPMTQELLGRSNKRRLAILINGANANQNFNFLHLKNLMELRKLSTYTTPENTP
ncbi:MAG: insulinase family protein [Parachlamydiaceae bacterium]|nr:insulinase family protein [Parachlamydiaceae bacterium]